MQPVIYVVGGFMRSGTSMMMRCLEAGGLEAIYNKERDRQNEDRWADDAYHPNEGGFYELKAHEYRNPNLLDCCEGRVVKSLRCGPLRLPEGRQYSIVVMRRDSEEIRQSVQATFSTSLPRCHGENANRMINGVVSELKRRPNWSVREVQYRDVVDSPLAAFEALGWPIDPAKAVAVVTPALCRYRREKLYVGV